MFFLEYIEVKYVAFENALSTDTTIINWLFYVSPIVLGISLVIIFINQINLRIKNTIQLNERKRYVDSVDGSLQAILALSINNEDARKEIREIMDKIIDNTIKSSIKTSEPDRIESEQIKDPLSTLKNIKDLLN